MEKNYCVGCGQSLMSTMRICPACGCKTFSSTPVEVPLSKNPEVEGYSAPVSQRASGQTFTVNPGIRGWLLFLCISLTILYPLSTTIEMLGEWAGTRDYFHVAPSLKAAVMLEIIGWGVLAGFAAYSGLQLWQQKAGAVNLAKKFLVANAIVGISLPIIVAMMINVPGVGGEVVKIIFKSLIYSGIWYWYLSKSVRVKATFGTN